MQDCVIRIHVGQRQTVEGTQTVRTDVGRCGTRVGCVLTKVNKSDHALVCFCLVYVNPLGLFDEHIS